MAIYLDPACIRPADTGQAAFDRVYKPGDVPAHSGIFKCQQCGVEAVAESSRKLPPTATCAEHHPEGAGKVGKVTWKMIVYAQHLGD